MKLLIVTQTVDTQDPILGFFVRWIEEFAKNCEQIHVLALNVGEYEFPGNVTVHCLGKSEGKSKLIWLWRLWWNSWRLRSEYTAVFVHMNPEYVLFGKPVWRLVNKKITMWYAHGAVSENLKRAEKVVDTIFTSTLKGFQLPSNKVEIVGQGIDIEHFTFQPKDRASKPLQLVTVGRISPAKQLETLIEAGALLHKQDCQFELHIVGESVTEEEIEYRRQLIKLIEEKNLSDNVILVGKVTNYELPAYFVDKDVFIQDGRTGSLDKAILEALSCGLPVISSNEAYTDFALQYSEICCFRAGDSAQLCALLAVFEDGYEDYQFATKVMRDKIVADYSVEGLIKRIIENV